MTQNASEQTAAEGAGFRLWRAVRAAHRPSRARPACIFRDRPVRHHGRRGARDGALRADPLRRPRVRVRRGRPDGRSGHLRAGPAHPGILLRPPGDRRHARRRGGPLRDRRVRPRHHRARPRERAVQRHAARADRVDEPPRCRLARARGLCRDGQHFRVPGRRYGERRASHLHHAVPSRGQAHRVRPAAAQELPVRHLRPRGSVDHGQPGRDHDGRVPCGRGRGPRDPGALRRRGFLRGGGPRRPCRGTPDDLRVHQPRAAPQGRTRAGGGGLHQAVRCRLRARARRGALRRAARRRDRSRGEAPHHRHAVLERVLRRGQRNSSKMAAR